MGILTWILIGLIGGLGARFILKRSFSWMMTIGLGILGAMLGGYIGTLLGLGDVDGFSIGSVALAVGGTVLVFILYEALVKFRDQK